METNNAFYINKIKEDLSLKQRANPQYSLRAYAKHLGVHSSTLSQVLTGKRGLPKKNAAGQRLSILKNFYYLTFSIFGFQWKESHPKE